MWRVADDLNFDGVDVDTGKAVLVAVPVTCTDLVAEAQTRQRRPQQSGEITEG
jgi:hypothetical protein